MTGESTNDSDGGDVDPSQFQSARMLVDSEGTQQRTAEPAAGRSGEQKKPSTPGAAFRSVAHASHRVAHGVTHTLDTGSRWTFGCIRRGIVNVPGKWPRTYSFVIGAVIPLWILIGVSVLLGIYLAQAEQPGEIDSNDAILARRAAIVFEEILNNNTDRIDLNQTNAARTLLAPQHIHDPDAVRRTYHRLLATGADSPRALPRRFLQDADGDGGQIGSDAEELFETYFDGFSLQSFDDLTEAFDDLSFSWIRCWNEEEVDLHLVFRPTDKQIRHARYESQLDHYIQSWTEDHASLFQQYLSQFESTTPELQRMAFDRATAEATGSNSCDGNYAGTAWFWFTVMTTVGYGNQAPSSQAGRAMVWTAGFFSILLFAAILGFAGYIFSSIFDDLMTRNRLKFLSYPGMGCIFWGSLWFIWMLVISHSIDEFWSKRLGDEQFADRGDTLWFAYISTTTVGLGDFFLQPEVVFMVDVLHFSLLFLVGFVLLSSFLGRFGALLSNLAPNIGERLPERLKNTHIILCEPTDFGFLHNYGMRTEEEVLRDRRQNRLRALQRLLRDHRQEDANGIDPDIAAAFAGEESPTAPEQSEANVSSQRAEGSLGPSDASGEHPADTQQDDEHVGVEDDYEDALEKEAQVLRRLLRIIESKQERRRREKDMHQRIEEQQSKMAKLNERSSLSNPSTGSQPEEEEAPLD